MFLRRMPSRRYIYVWLMFSQADAIKTLYICMVDVSQADAIKTFEKKFRDKTKNAWGTSADDFEKYHGMVPLCMR